MIAHFLHEGYGAAMSITPDQCRAARALVNLSQQGLAEASGVSLRTISHFEKGERTPIPANMRALRSALEAAGVIFIDANGGGPGVRLRHGPSRAAGDE